MSVCQSKWWDDDRIRWYEKAASKTDFHRLLAEEIESLITKEEKILELGAGLGYVSSILMDDGYSLVSSDNDENAIAIARKRSGRQKSFIALDAETDEIPKCDALLLIYFGRIKEKDNLTRYLESAEKIIYVISEHRGQNIRRFREPEDTIAFLSLRKDISFTYRHFSARFDQVLDSREDAEDFVRRMYRDKAERYLGFIEERDGCFVFPNMKHSTIFMIRRKE